LVSPPPSAFKKALKLVFGAVVGMTVATFIVQDLYKLGANSACHKWGKKIPKVIKQEDTGKISETKEETHCLTYLTFRELKC